jgi:hypothetical protein
MKRCGVGALHPNLWPVAPICSSCPSVHPPAAAALPLPPSAAAALPSTHLQQQPSHPPTCSSLRCVLSLASSVRSASACDCARPACTGERCTQWREGRAWGCRGSRRPTATARNTQAPTTDLLSQLADGAFVRLVHVALARVGFVDLLTRTGRNVDACGGRGGAGAGKCACGASGGSGWQGEREVRP